MSSRLRTYGLMLFLTAVSSFALAQQRRDTIAAIKELAIGENGIVALSQHPLDSITLDARDNTVVYCYSDYIESFWYKIYVNADCSIALDIVPTSADNTYNYFLYQHAGNIGLGDFLAKKIPPVRANLCKDDIGAGTGLSESSAVTYYDPQSKSKVKDFYHTPFHSAVNVKKGDVLFLNVYHITGQDCGFDMALKTNKCMQKVRAVYRLCYSERTKGGKIQRSVNLSPLNGSVVITPKATENKSAPVAAVASAVKSAVIAEVKASFMIKDSLNNSVLDAEVFWIRKRRGASSNMQAEIKGKNEAVLERNMEYHVVFAAVGYKNKNVFFSTGDSLVPVSEEVLLSPYKQGDNFVMDKIYFYPNSYDMKPGGHAELDKLAVFLKMNPLISIEIQGHTNGNKRIKASYEGNFKGSSKKLSQYRAEIIKKYLVEKGVQGERLLAHGYGGAKMIYADPKNQAQANRNIRVEVLILSEKDGALSSSTQMEH